MFLLFLKVKTYYQDKKNLRLVSTTLKRRVEKEEKSIRTLTARSIEDIEQMNQITAWDVIGIRLYKIYREIAHRLTGIGPKFPQLEILDLSLCGELTDTGLATLLHMSGDKLKDLNLAGNWIVTGDSLGGLGLQFPHLEILNISDCGELTDTGLMNLLQMSGNKLKQLKLYDNVQVSGDCLGGLELQFPHLDILSISNCRKLTGTGLINLLQMSGNKLKHLKLVVNQLVTGDCLVGLELQFPHLESLNLFNCTKLTDTGLVNLLQMSGNKLVNVDLSFCIQLSEEGLQELKKISKGQLKTLNCSGIPALSSTLIEEFKEQFPGCEIKF